LRGEGRRLAAALETQHAGRRPRDRIALRVRNRDHRVVERGIHVGDARRDILPFLALYANLVLRHPSSTFVSREENAKTAAPQKNIGARYFFLPAIALAGPLRVRA